MQNRSWFVGLDIQEIFAHPCFCPFFVRCCLHIHQQKTLSQGEQACILCFFHMLLLPCHPFCHPCWTMLDHPAECNTTVDHCFIYLVIHLWECSKVTPVIPFTIELDRIFCWHLSLMLPKKVTPIFLHKYSTLTVNVLVCDMSFFHSFNFSFIDVPLISELASASPSVGVIGWFIAASFRMISRRWALTCNMGDVLPTWISRICLLFMFMQFPLKVQWCLVR